MNRSLNARLNALEKKVVPKDEPHDMIDQCDFEDLLFLDYEDYRKVFVAWLMSQYMDDREETARMREKIDELNESLSPITSFSDFNFKKHEDLLVKAIVDWMEDNGIDELDEDRWSALTEEINNYYM